MTERIIPVDTDGPIHLNLAMNTGTIRIAVDTRLKRASVRLTTDAEAGPSADAIRDATARRNGHWVTLRVPDIAGAAGGTTTIRSGGSTMTFSGGQGVQITGGNVHITGHGGGKVFVNGREVTADGSPGAAYTPITAEIRLPAGSYVTLTTHMADTHVAGALERLEYTGTSGSLAAESVGELDVTLTSGSASVGRVSSTLDAILTSGVLNIGEYSGSDARLNLTSGAVRMHAAPDSTGRLKANVTSGAVTVTGAAHLDVRRNVTSGSVRIS